MNWKKAYLLFSLWLGLISSAGLTASAQMPGTVGDATRFLFQQGKTESYGIQGSDIGGKQFGQDLFTRHQKEGNELGIGSSSLQTTTVNSEGGAAAIAPFSVTKTTSEFVRPSINLGSAIQGYSNTSPALNGFTISPNSGIFSGSGLTSPYADYAAPGSPPPSNLYQDLNTVPSFNRSGPRIEMPSASVKTDESVLRKGEFQY